MNNWHGKPNSPSLSGTCTIHKQRLEHVVVNEVTLPTDFEVVKFDMQDGEPTIWYIRTVEEIKPITRKFKIMGTGMKFDYSSCRYVDSCFDRGFVWHLFEVSW